MHQADDVVDGIFIDGQARIIIFAEYLQNFLHRALAVDRDHVHAGDEDILHLQIVEFQRGTHQLGFVLP